MLFAALGIVALGVVTTALMLSNSEGEQRIRVRVRTDDRRPRR